MSNYLGLSTLLIKKEYKSFRKKYRKKSRTLISKYEKNIK